MKFTYVCGAIHEASSKKFWLYELTPGVKKALEEYKEFMGDE
jgi:hypothetical protein